MQQCRQHGLSVREPYGVWGGLTEEDREAIYLAERKQRRAAAQSEGLAAAS
jgi:WhiB family redox-sensing transcriptional regulator